MTRPVFAPPLGPEFDRFLYAFIGADPNGTMLSMLSAFARTNVDPWKEAAQLARMSRENATTRLTQFILTLPNQPHAGHSAQAIAGELIALLPAPSGVGLPLPGNLTKTFSGAYSGLGTSLAVALFLAGFAFLYWINHVPAPPAPLPATVSEKTTTALTPRELGH
jgi:hypothetical protein